MVRWRHHHMYEAIDEHARIWSSTAHQLAVEVLRNYILGEGEWMSFLSQFYHHLSERFHLLTHVHSRNGVILCIWFCILFYNNCNFHEVRKSIYWILKRMCVEYQTIETFNTSINLFCSYFLYQKYLSCCTSASRYSLLLETRKGGTCNDLLAHYHFCCSLELIFLLGCLK